MNVWTVDGQNGKESVRFRPALLEVNTPEALATGVWEGLGIGLIPIYLAISGLRNVVPSPCGGRLAEFSLERAIERGFRFVTDSFGN